MVASKKEVYTHMNMGYTTNITKNIRNGSRKRYEVVVSRIISLRDFWLMEIFLVLKKMLLSR